MGLDMKMKKKLSEEIVKRYCTAAKKQKTKIIYEFMATIGYNRKYEKYYGHDVQEQVIRLWLFMCLCAKCLLPFIRDNISKFGYNEKLKVELSRISNATIGRILKL